MKKLLFTVYLLLVALLIIVKCSAQTWSPNPKYIKTQKGPNPGTAPAQKFQCWGTTQKGERCKRKVDSARAYCYQHTNQK